LQIKINVGQINVSALKAYVIDTQNGNRFYKIGMSILPLCLDKLNIAVIK